MKCIILCADDYGQNPAISQAIVHLIQKKRLSATSCMTNSPFWLADSVKLKPFWGQIDIGLHFNLTEGKSLTSASQFESLKTCLLKSSLRMLSARRIEQELHAQIDQFTAAIGFLPDFIDGHQHIHQLPVIRDVLIKVYQSRFKASGAYIRSVYDKEAWVRFRDQAYFKQLIIQLSGAKALKVLLNANKIPHNSSFSGVYPFVSSEKFAQLFDLFLNRVDNNGLIMCHPGAFTQKEYPDVIDASRPDEYQFLLSDTYLELCQKNNVRVTRFLK